MIEGMNKKVDRWDPSLRRLKLMLMEQQDERYGWLGEGEQCMLRILRASLRQIYRLKPSRSFSHAEKIIIF